MLGNRLAGIWQGLGQRFLRSFYCGVLFGKATVTRWWFQIFFLFSPLPGEDSHFV